MSFLNFPHVCKLYLAYIYDLELRHGGVTSTVTSSQEGSGFHFQYFYVKFLCSPFACVGFCWPSPTVQNIYDRLIGDSKLLLMGLS